ncbi:MAG: tRNA (adenosine(37)-N6)-threonylcarbamoyltransferase complex ATPase subunit type 1 TsaE [Synechococcaceae cyanobacterium]|nr:tRNA (adenosine(37)-N6)-threonylcarbamoyltransferase complex ATPase subunit type 1 TsaE [Synechococcaceae cyanobacterium]
MTEPPIRLEDPAATVALGRRLALRLLPLCAPGQAPLLLLQGDLGAGKTCLVQGLAAGLGIDEPITSPSFALAHHYSGRCQGRDTHLVHLDLYRLEDPAAADELLAQEEEEALGLGAVLAVEWPGRLRVLPEPAWRLRLAWLEEGDPQAGRLAWVSPPAG